MSLLLLLLSPPPVAPGEALGTRKAIGMVRLVVFCQPATGEGVAEGGT